MLGPLVSIVVAQVAKDQTAKRPVAGGRPSKRFETLLAVGFVAAIVAFGLFLAFYSVPAKIR